MRVTEISLFALGSFAALGQHNEQGYIQTRQPRRNFLMTRVKLSLLSAVFVLMQLTATAEDAPITIGDLQMTETPKSRAFEQTAKNWQMARPNDPRP